MEKIYVTFNKIKIMNSEGLKSEAPTITIERMDITVN